MDWIIWLIVIAAIVAVVWWLLNRNSSRRNSDATGSGTAAAAPHAPHVHDAGQAAPRAEPEPPAAPEPEPARVPESPGAAAVQPAPRAASDEKDQGPGTPPSAPQAASHVPVHHKEYTEPHAPTLPGAESAAAEAGLDTAVPEGRTAAPRATTQSPLTDADARHTAMFLDAPNTATRHEAEPGGHLAAAEPYGEGSAAPAADGSGPEGFTVKGYASSMVYYDETNSAFEETRAEVWFLSTAHAEAAGFRPPRRTRQ